MATHRIRFRASHSVCPERQRGPAGIELDLTGSEAILRLEYDIDLDHARLDVAEIINVGLSRFVTESVQAGYVDPNKLTIELDALQPSGGR